jgi:hypothetical protein
VNLNDLRTLAVEAWAEYNAVAPSVHRGVVDKILAAVLPKHRQMVAEEIAQAIDAFSDKSVCQWTKGEAVATARDHGAEEGR